MVISIRRSRHEEGEDWLRFGVVLSMPLTIFYQQSSGRAGRAGAFLSAGSTVVGRVNERDQPVGFMLLSGQHMDGCLSILMCAAAAWAGCW